MRHDPDDARDTHRRLAGAARLLRRPRPRVKAKPAAMPASANVVASFAMIAGLLMVWAMTVNM